MPLVDYGSSGESESDLSGDENENKSDLTENDSKKVEEVSNSQTNFDKSTNLTSSTEQKLFANLPLPRSSLSLGENAFKLLNKSRNQPVKIILPSLSELQSEDNEEVKKKKPSTKGSGLFALLPAPKNVTSLVPNSIQNKLNSVRKIKPVPKKNNLLPALKSTGIKAKIDEDEDDHEEGPTSFFFTSDDNLQPTAIEDKFVTSFPDTKSDASFENVQVTNTQNIEVINSAVGNENDRPSYSQNSISNSEIVQNCADIGNLDDEAIEKLCGTRARKRKGEVPEEVIDINVNSMVGDAYMWLSKDLTKDHEHRGFKKAKNLSVVERRKHQITYLASQAKEKEMELRNQWANSRMTRQQTQSKYGF